MQPKNLFLALCSWLPILTPQIGYSLTNQKDTLYWSDTVTLVSDLYIPSGKLLAINPGTVVILEESSRIIVSGGLLAAGNPVSAIEFKGPALTATNGSSGIRITGGTDTAIFEFCQFAHCGSLNAGGGDDKGAVNIENREKVIFQHCSFKGNYAIISGGAISSLNSGLEITNCHFQDNYSDFTGGALEVSGGTTARIINCSFIDNTARVNGGGARIVDNPSVIEGNIFLQNSATDTISPGNTTGNGGALYLSYAHEGMTLISNIMENNRSNSSLYESTRYSLITNNLITNNAGIGLVCGHTGSVSRYVNNTICSNEDGGFAMGSATAWIGNNIIAYNGIGGASAQMLIYADTPVVYHSCIPGGYIPQYSQGVMDADPLFINPSNHPGLLDTSLKHDWRLQLGSPCLDAGTLMVPGGVLPASDLTGAPRISGQGVDMGAYEHQVNGVINSTSPDPGTTIVPNPAQYNIRVRSGEEFTKGKLSMTDLTGISVLDRSFSPGEYIDIGHLRPGVYVCRILTSSGNTSCQKLIKY